VSTVRRTVWNIDRIAANGFKMHRRNKLRKNDSTSFAGDRLSILKEFESFDLIAEIVLAHG
jgi:hypothetical protein